MRPFSYPAAMNVDGHTSVSMMRQFPAFLVLITSACLPIGSAYAQDARTAEELQKARQYFISGTALQLQGNRHAEAILEFQESLKYDSSAVTLAAMARSFVALRKLDRAQEIIESALRLDSTSTDSWELLAEILISSGRYDEGIAAYEQIRGLQPTKRQLYTLGRLYEPRDADKAIAIYQELAAKHPDVDVLLRMATLYERKRDRTGQVRTLEQAQQLEQDNVSIAIELVDVYLRAGRLEDAAALARSWSTRTHASEGSLRVWGSMLSAMLEDSLVVNLYLEQTQLMLDDAMRWYPKSFPITSLVGSVAMSINDMPRAQVAFSTAARLVQQRAEPLLQIAAVYLGTGHPAEAIAFLNEWQPVHPSDPRFLLMLGDAYLLLPDETRAVAYYRTALDLDPMILEAWLQLGGLYDGMGVHDSSDAAYDRVLELDPLNVIASNNYAYSLAIRGQDLQRARELAWNAVQQQPENPAYLDTYAWVLFQSGDAERARVFIDQAVTYGGNATHYRHLGDILERIGEIDGAIRAWRDSLERDPDQPDLKDKIDRYR